MGHLNLSPRAFTGDLINPQQVVPAVWGKGLGCNFLGVRCEHRNLGNEDTTAQTPQRECVPLTIEEKAHV